MDIEPLCAAFKGITMFALPAINIGAILGVLQAFASIIPILLSLFTGLSTFFNGVIGPFSP